MITTVISMIIFGFLSGSIMFSYLIPKYWRGVDIIKSSPDNNPGGANSFKLCGVHIGLLCISLDFLKAFIPLYISINIFNITDIFLIPIALSPVLGHSFSPFLKFKGGKAIASTFGTLFALLPLSNIVIIFALLLIFFKTILVINPNSTMVLISVIIFDIYLIFCHESLVIKIIGLLLSIILSYKHKSNKNPEKFSVKLLNKYSIF